jgi:hypothetical protein
VDETMPATCRILGASLLLTNVITSVAELSTLVGSLEAIVVSTALWWVVGTHGAALSACGRGTGL